MANQNVVIDMFGNEWPAIRSLAEVRKDVAELGSITGRVEFWALSDSDLDAWAMAKGVAQIAKQLSPGEAALAWDVFNELEDVHLSEAIKGGRRPHLI